MKRKSRLAPYSIEWLFKWVSPEPNSGCWLWTGTVNPGGYGCVGYNGRTRGAHRVSYTLSKGPIAPGMDLDHLCRVRCCVNPDHLEPVTRSVNLRRGEAGKHIAVHARGKTHCPQGHPYQGSNLFIDAKGNRDCKACRLRRTSEWRAKQRLCEGISA